MNKQIMERLTSRFSMFVVGTLVASSATGYMCFSIVDNRKYNSGNQQEELTSLEQGSVDTLSSSSSSNTPSSSRMMTPDEVRLQAMIENAKNSSISENLDNAFQAQERFMLPNRKHDTKPDFVKKIDQRSHEILKEKQQEKKLANNKEATNFW